MSFIFAFLIVVFVGGLIACGVEHLVRRPHWPDGTMQQGPDELPPL